MKAKWCILALVVLGLVLSHSMGFAGGPPTISNNRSLRFQAFAPSDGELGMFLVGTWDLRRNTTVAVAEVMTTIVKVVNPTPDTLWAFVTFWDDAENGLACNNGQLTPNGYLEVSYTTNIGAADHGVIKVLATNALNGQPEIGLVGYRKEIHEAVNCIDFPVCAILTGTLSTSEIRLQPVPWRVLSNDFAVDGIPDEIKAIRDLVALHCP